MDNLNNTDTAYPLRGTPEYRKRYWALVGIRTLTWIVLLIGVFCGVLGRAAFATVGWVTAGLALVIGLVVQTLLGRLIARGRKPGAR